MCRNSTNIFKMRTILDLVLTIRMQLSNLFWPELLFPHKLHFQKLSSLAYIHIYNAGTDLLFAFDFTLSAWFID